MYCFFTVGVFHKDTDEGWGWERWQLTLQSRLNRVSFTTRKYAFCSHYFPFETLHFCSRTPNNPLPGPGGIYKLIFHFLCWFFGKKLQNGFKPDKTFHMEPRVLKCAKILSSWTCKGMHHVYNFANDGCIGWSVSQVRYLVIRLSNWFGFCCGIKKHMNPIVSQKDKKEG